MKYKKNKFLIFFLFNILLLFFIFLLAIPASKFLNKIVSVDNRFVIDQVIINPNAKSSKVLNRTIKINFKIWLIFFYGTQ